MTKHQKHRVASLIKKRYPHLSNSTIKSLLEQKQVSVGDHVAKKHDWVEADVKIEIPQKFLSKHLVPNENISCKLLQKTDDYIFFEKGSCVHSVALNVAETESAANWLLTVDPALSDVSGPLESGLVHRLDFETSGVMVAARSKQSFEYLRNLFQNKRVNKIYHCVVSAKPPAFGKYFAYVEKEKQLYKKVKLFSHEDVQGELISLCTEILETKELESNRYLLKVRLITGFRHQIRVHLAFLGCPIVGDSLYGGEKAERLMLHASEISFKDKTGKEVSVNSTPPSFAQ